jgi:hypothetical protein
MRKNCLEEIPEVSLREAEHGCKDYKYCHWKNSLYLILPHLTLNLLFPDFYRFQISGGTHCLTGAAAVTF